MTEIVLHVTGLPAPQGSKKAWVNKHTGRAQMREQSSDRISLWRQDVKAAAQEWVENTDDGLGPLEGPLDLRIIFQFPRPKTHYRSGKSTSHLLRDNAPAYPATRGVGDADKCARSTMDALVTAGMFADDSQVVHLDVWEVYADHGFLPGAFIGLRTLPLDDDQPWMCNDCSVGVCCGDCDCCTDGALFRRIDDVPDPGRVLS